MIKIVAGIPMYHSVQPEPFMNFLVFSQVTGMAEKEGRYGVRWCVVGPKFKTVTARNIVSQLAISGGADYLLLMDDDMTVPRNLLDVLLRRNVDIVSPIFFRSEPPVDPLVYVFNEFGDRVPYYDYPKNSIFETPGGNGTGVMLIKIEVLKAMEAPIWKGLVDPEIAEDVEFCDRAHKLGFKTWCDSSIEAGQMSASVVVGSKAYEDSRLTT